MGQTPLQEQVQISSSPPTPQPIKSSNSLRNVISVSAAVLAASFLMPWATFLGGNISGLDIQKHFESYQYVWLLPACALATLSLNLAGAPPTPVVRRITGLIPFGILAYSLNKFGSDLFQILSWGGWLALAAGIALIVTPSAVKSQPKT